MSRPYTLVCAALGLSLALAACTVSSDMGANSASSGVSASGTFGGVPVLVWLPFPELEADTAAGVGVRVTNSTDSTLACETLFRLEIRNNNGALVLKADSGAPHEPAPQAPPHRTYSCDPQFTVPPPGDYTLSVTATQDDRGRPLSLPFTSVR